jgi:hypothetical protein
MKNPSNHVFLQIHPRVPLDNMLGWAEDKRTGKKVPKALWAITKRVGKGCRAKSDTKRHGFDLYAWQKSILAQLVHFMRQSESKHIVLLPAPPRSWTVHCQPSIRDRRQRDYESRVAYRAKLDAEAKGEVYVATSDKPAFAPKQVSTPPSPSCISLFPPFGLAAPSPPATWKPPQAVLQAPSPEATQPKRVVLKTCRAATPCDDSEWDDEDEEDFLRFESEQDLVIFER